MTVPKTERSATAGDNPAGDVQSYFERSASTFDNLYRDEAQNPLMRWLNRQFRSDIASRFNSALEHASKAKARTVLDVGCGSGRYMAALIDEGVKRVVGLDLSAPMLEMAGRRLDGLDTSRFGLEQVDFASWETGDRFDLILAMGFFDYVENPQALLAKMGKMANHSVVATFPSRHWIRMPIRKVRYIIKRCPVRFYSRNQILQLGRIAGFKSMEVDFTPGARTSYLAKFWNR